MKILREKKSPVTTKLLNFSFADQIYSIQRTRITDPCRLIAWFKYLEKHPKTFKEGFFTLDSAEKDSFAELQNVYEVILNRPFSCQSYGNLATIPMETAFQNMTDLVRVVTRKHANGLLIVGPGGTGKTFQVLQTLKEENFTEPSEFIRITGFSSPLGLYNTLYQNRQKLLIFDDCDAIFKDDQGLNILKATLDTIPRRTVSWISTSTKADVPQFFFEGQVIFISNMDPSRVQNFNFRALLTRVMTLVMGHSKAELLVRMGQVLPQVGRELTPEQQAEIMVFLREHKEAFKELSLRFLVHLVGLRMYSEQNWKRLALALKL